MPRTPVLLLLITVVVGAMSSPADADPESPADDHLATGLAHYEAREFEQAIAEFHAGYKLTQAPEFLFALGQAERLSGDCASALVYYERFLFTEPPERQVRAARMHKQRCEVALASRPGQRGRIRPSVARAARTARAVRAARAARPLSLSGLEPAAQPQALAPWYHDAVGGSLLGTAAVSVAAGVYLLQSSSMAVDKATMAFTYSEYDMSLAQARQQRTWGLVSLAAGSALLTGAVYRFVDQRARRELMVAPQHGGVAVSVGGRF